MGTPMNDAGGQIKLIAAILRSLGAAQEDLLRLNETRGWDLEVGAAYGQICDAMLRAQRIAERIIRDLPVEDGR